MGPLEEFQQCAGGMGATILLLCGIPEEPICKLQRVQNNAARVVTLTRKHDHITPVLKELHWLPVRKRIEFKILLLAYMCLHGTAPSYLREMLKEYVPPRTLRSTPRNLLCEPRTNMKTYGDRSFSAFASAPKLWNQLPNNIRAAGSVGIGILFFVTFMPILANS